MATATFLNNGYWVKALRKVDPQRADDLVMNTIIAIKAGTLTSHIAATKIEKAARRLLKTRQP